MAEDIAPADPVTFEETITSRERCLWQAAMEDEMASHRANKT